MNRFNQLKTMSAESANSMGCGFYHGRSVTKDFEKAVACFKYAREKGCKFGYYNMGLCYLRGNGVEKNIKLAAKNFAIALVKDKAKMETLIEALNLTGEECNEIGKIFFYGDGVKRSGTQAIHWFFIAREKGCVLGTNNIAVSFHDPRYTDYDLYQAVMYYNEAIENGCELAKENLKSLFENLDYKQDLSNEFGANLRFFKKSDFKSLTLLGVKYLRQHQPDRFINFVGEEGSTLLHRTAQAKTLKNTARLMLLGADHSLVDNVGKTPFQYLSKKEQVKVTHLKNIIANSFRELQLSSVSVVASRMTIDNGSISEADKIAMLEELYAIPEIAPLIDLAKLAALGLHDLSRQKKFSNDDYDSDHDDEPKYNSIHDSQKLSIRLDAKSTTVENLFFRKDGLDGKNAHGIYCYEKNDNNSIYIGIKQTFRRLTPAIRGTIVHELTHFIAEEIFNNKCNPYDEWDEVNEQLFENIAESIQEKIANGEPIDPILKIVVESYHSSQYPCELIVRVPQMIVHYLNVLAADGGDGYARLRQQVPALLDYYNNEFLRMIRIQIAQIEHRAMGCWPKELFEENMAAAPRL